MGVRELVVQLSAISSPTTAGHEFPVKGQGVLYCGSVRQAVSVFGAGSTPAVGPPLASDQDASEGLVKLRFVYEAEWIIAGSSVILCLSGIRYVGKVLSVAI